MKMALYSVEGELIWKKELGKGVINGIWFTPVYPVDLDGDGFHEFACALGEQSDRKIYGPEGKIEGNLGEKAYIAMASIRFRIRFENNKAFTCIVLIFN